MALITSAATGNWATGATWTGGVAPGAGDQAKVQGTHVVTIPVATTVTVGHGPDLGGDAVPAIEIATGGQLVLNGTLNCRGDFKCSASNTTRSYVQGPGATFNFDTSEAATPANAIYQFIQPSQYPGTQPSAQINGTNGSHAVFTATGGGKGRFVGTGANYFSLLEAYYCDFSKLGSNTLNMIAPSVNSDVADPSSRFILENCTFTDCGPINTNGVNIDPRAKFRMYKNKFTGSLQSFCLQISSYGAKLGTNSERLLEGNKFDKHVRLYSPRDFTIKYNYFGEAWTTTSTDAAGWAEFRYNTVRQPNTTFNDSPANGHVLDNFFVFDSGVATNIHILGVGAYAGPGTYNIKGNIFKFTGTDATGDCITISSPSGPVTINIENNIVLPNEDDETTGTLVSALGNANTTLNINHNTVHLGTGGGVALGETYAGHAGMVTSCRSNLFWDTSARAHKVYDSGTDNSVPDLVTAANLNYNGGFNFLAGDVNGYNNLEFSSGTPGANDITGDPVFFDDTVDLDEWDHILGGAGTISAALTRLQNDPTLITTLLSFVREGYAPTETDYEDAGHDGLTIGAVPFSGTAPATGFSFVGPAAGLVGVASTNFTVVPNGLYTGTVTPSAGGGGGTFSPTTLTWTGDQAVKTFTYTPATVGVKTISITNSEGLTNPANVTYTVTAAAATGFTFTGPAAGLVGVASTNFSVTPNGLFTGTVTPGSGGGGGSFTPTSLTWSGTNETKTFTYTPTTAGVKSISITNSASLTNPSPVTYTASSGAATGFLFTGPLSGPVNELSAPFTVTPNADYTGTVTPVATGGGTFSPTSLSWTNSTASQIFYYIPATEGAKTINLTNSEDLTNPAPLSYTSLPKAATGFSFSGPTEGDVGEASAEFTITPNGTFTGTITPTAGSGGGNFVPSSLSWSESSSAKQFVYVAVTDGTKTISIPNDQGITEPAGLTYKASKKVDCAVTTTSSCDYYPFKKESCSSSLYASYSAPGGPSPCVPHFPVLKSDFTVPGANSSFIVSVSDTTSLYLGQGIRLGPISFQVTDILSSTSVELKHNGLGATEGLSIVAVHPAYGCYQYPITPAGFVPLEKTPNTAGYASNASTVVGSAFTQSGANRLSYGYLGPGTIHYDYNLQGTIANSPIWIGVTLPKPVRTDAATHVPVASYFNGSTWANLITRVLGIHAVLVGKEDGSAFASGGGILINISGNYEASL